MSKSFVVFVVSYERKKKEDTGNLMLQPVFI